MEAEELVAEGEEQPLFLPTPPSWRLQERSRGWPSLPLLFLLFFFFALSLVRSISWDRPGRRTKGRETDCMYLAMIFLVRMRVVNKKKTTFTAATRGSFIFVIYLLAAMLYDAAGGCNLWIIFLLVITLKQPVGS